MAACASPACSPTPPFPSPFAPAPRPHQELHEESVPRINYFRTCRNLMAQCEAPEYTLTDWMKPEPPRLKKALSGVINFAKYWEDKVEQLRELTARSVRIFPGPLCRQSTPRWHSTVGDAPVACTTIFSLLVSFPGPTGNNAQ